MKKELDLLFGETDGKQELNKLKAEIEEEKAKEGIISSANSNRVIDDAKSIANTEVIEEFHEHDKVEEISSHNFVKGQ